MSNTYCVSTYDISGTREERLGLPFAEAVLVYANWYKQYSIVYSMGVRLWNDNLADGDNLPYGTTLYYDGLTEDERRVCDLLELLVDRGLY